MNTVNRHPTERDALRAEIAALMAQAAQPVAWRYRSKGDPWTYVGGPTQPTWPWKTPECQALYEAPKVARNRHRIVEATQGVNDYELLRKLAELIGYKEQP